MSPEQQALFAKGYISRMGLPPTAENMNRAMQMLYSSEVVDPAIANAGNNASQADWVADPYNIGGSGDPGLQVAPAAAAPQSIKQSGPSGGAAAPSPQASTAPVPARKPSQMASVEQAPPAASPAAGTAPSDDEMSLGFVPFVPMPAKVPQNSATGVATVAQQNKQPSVVDPMEQALARGGLSIASDGIVDAEFEDVTGHKLNDKSQKPNTVEGTGNQKRLPGSETVYANAPAAQNELPAPNASNRPEQFTPHEQGPPPTDGLKRVTIGKGDVYINPQTGDIYDAAGRALNHKFDLQLLKALRVL
jgi:hypothetical protein